MAITWHSPCHDPGSIPGIGEYSFYIFFPIVTKHYKFASSLYTTFYNDPININIFFLFNCNKYN